MNGERSTADGMGAACWKLALVTGLVVSMLLGSTMSALAGQSRIVVLPFYSEEGRDARASYADEHYRRIMRFINNQLVRHDFEVVNAFAADSSEREYNRVMERAREDSPMAALEMCKKYGTDAAYLVWLKVKVEHTPDGYCKAAARIDGEGYDSAAHDLGVGLSKTFKVTRRDCDDAIIEVEKEVGDLVGRKLTAWDGTRKSKNVVATTTASTAAPNYGGALQQNIDAKENTINLRLDGATDYELAEVFGKVVNTVTGVVEAKRYRSQIVTDNPQASFVLWRVTIKDTDPFRLEANINKMIHDIQAANGKIVLKGVAYRYTHDELEMLRGFRPGNSTTREVQFVIDRERARDKELSGGRKGFE